MTIPPDDALVALTPVVDALDRVGVRYHVGGSMASSVYGTARSTADVDVVADLALDQVDAFVHELESAYYVNTAAVREAIRLKRSFNLIHLSTFIKIDIFVPEQRPFDQQEQSRAQRHPLDGDADARQFLVKSPEDLVLRKLVWYRAGGEVSTQQWSDVLGVLKLQVGRLDVDYLRHWAAELGVSDLLERALADASQASTVR
jgi:hypothetical protein